MSCALLIIISYGLFNSVKTLYIAQSIQDWWLFVCNKSSAQKEYFHRLRKVGRLVGWIHVYVF